MPASGCIENQYSKGKEKVVTNAHCINANLLAAVDATCAYFLSNPAFFSCMRMDIS